MTQVVIKNVNVVHMTKGKGYDVAEVTYSMKGETKHYKIMSFINPQLFAYAKEWQPEDIIDFEWTKNDKTGYMDLTNARKLDKASASTTTSVTRPSSTYETADERAYRQALIVRQSCLAQAVASVGNAGTTEEYLERADQFVDWVMQKDAEDILGTEA